MDSALQDIVAASRAAGGSANTGEAAAPADEEKLREAAKRFEQSFIAQMLTHSGLAEALTAGEAQGADAFTGFYIDQLAEQLAEDGGFGLAGTIYEKLVDYSERGGANERSVRL